MKIVYFLIFLLLSYLTWEGALRAKSGKKNLYREPFVFYIYLQFISSTILFLLMSLLIITNTVTVDDMENIIRMVLPD